MTSEINKGSLVLSEHLSPSKKGFVLDHPDSYSITCTTVDSINGIYCSFKAKEGTKDLIFQ